jgi:protein-tyrosine phosphatase
MADARTSASHPIRVDFVPDAEHGLPGRIGMTFAPGKQQRHALSGAWARDLARDLAELRDTHGADVLVSLVEAHELTKLGIERLADACVEAGIALDRFPIRDASVPTDGAGFDALVARTLAHARAGRTVVIHCMGGLGRTGLLAACCLRALGVEARRALAVVRAARPGAVETEAQERFVSARP